MHILRGLRRRAARGCLSQLCWESGRSANPAGSGAGALSSVGDAGEQTPHRLRKLTGAWTAHVPYPVTWAHEMAQAPAWHPRFVELAGIADLPAWVRGLG